MSIRRGDVFWLCEPQPGQTDAVRHPWVVVQDDLFNASRIDTIVLCGLTSRLGHAGEPGNVLVEAGEANLPRTSVVVGSNIVSVHRDRLTEPIGRLSQRRIEQVIDALRVLQRRFER